MVFFVVDNAHRGGEQYGLLGLANEMAWRRKEIKMQFVTIKITRLKQNVILIVAFFLYIMIPKKGER